MSQPYIGEMRIFSFNFPPRHWAMCNGQLMAINQNQALFSILGTTYGGNGQTTFALPDFRGRTPIHFGTGSDGINYSLGQHAGEENHTLITNEMPQHNHMASALNGSATVGDPANNLYAQAAYNLYNGGTNPVQMAPDMLSSAGGNQPHQNIQPYLVLNFCIALVGVFPSRN